MEFRIYKTCHSNLTTNSKLSVWFVHTYKSVTILFPLLYSTSSCTCAAVHWNLHLLVWSIKKKPTWYQLFSHLLNLQIRNESETTKMTYLQQGMSFSPPKYLYDIHLGSSSIQVLPGSFRLPLRHLLSMQVSAYHCFVRSLCISSRHWRLDGPGFKVPHK